MNYYASLAWVDEFFCLQFSAIAIFREEDQKVELVRHLVGTLEPFLGRLLTPKTRREANAVLAEELERLASIGALCGGPIEYRFSWCWPKPSFAVYSETETTGTPKTKS